jgi:hypothetical protein
MGQPIGPAACTTARPGWSLRCPSAPRGREFRPLTWAKSSWAAGPARQAPLALAFNRWIDRGRVLPRQDRDARERSPGMGWLGRASGVFQDAWIEAVLAHRY